MGLPLITIGAGLQLAGSLWGASSSIEAGKDQFLESKRAEVMTRIAARQRAADVRREGALFAGHQKAGYVSSGVLLDSGSPLLAIMDTAARVERNALRTESQGEEQARALSIQGQTQLSTAKNTALSLVLGGTGSALTSIGGGHGAGKAPAGSSGGSSSSGHGGH